jgi:uncharacterized protein DUF481
MKKTLTTAIFSIGAVFGFAQEAIQEPAINANAIPSEIKPAIPIEKKVSDNESFLYLKMSASDSQFNDFDQVKVVPGLGLGYRLASGSSALDVSASYNYRNVRDDEGTKQQTYFYTLPKANYLYYTTPASDHSFYAGAGLAWGGMKTQDSKEFMGLIPNAAIGYEISRKSAVRTFVQLDVSQPAIAATQKGSLPGPFAELSIGAGF